MRYTKLGIALIGPLAAGVLAFGGVPGASAASLPSCTAGTHCQDNTAGLAGYYGADDNHTNYRYVQTEVTATPQLVHLNGSSSPSDQGQVGVELCDPNSGFAAQLSLGYVDAAGATPAHYEARYRVGFFLASAPDQCVQNGFTSFNFQQGTPLGLNGISTGDQLTLALYYTPAGHHFHQISIGICDVTANVCRQAYNASPVAVHFFEFGIGAVANHQHLTAGANNPLDTFGADYVTCYSCAHMVPISTVAPVNSTNTGGLFETQFVNTSTQVTMSPNDSLSGTSFEIWNGSTSG